MALLGLKAFQTDFIHLCILVKALGVDMFTAAISIMRLLLGTVLIAVQLLRLVVDLTAYLVLGCATYLLSKTYPVVQAIATVAVATCIVRLNVAVGLVGMSVYVLVVFTMVSTVPFVEYLLSCREALLPYKSGESTTSN